MGRKRFSSEQIIGMLLHNDISGRCLRMRSDWWNELSLWRVSTAATDTDV